MKHRTPCVVVCIDGFGPEYLAASETANLDRLATSGWLGTVRAVVPTVTNVNNASLLTGAFPSVHGITGNYYLDPTSREGVYMESQDFLLAPTIVERLAERGVAAAIVTSKDKLRTLFERGATVSASAETPPDWLVEQLGPPPGMYSVEVNLWLLEAALAVLRARPEIQLLYVTTTDYVMHAYDPRHEESQRHVRELDRRIGQLVEHFGGAVNLVVTADHGMSPKRRAIDPEKLLARAGLSCAAIPIIKDRYVVHHQNLGGAAYLYLDPGAAVEESLGLLRETPGVEQVLTRGQAAERFQLRPERIGDLMLLGDLDTVFGYLPQAEAEVALRSHGSLHEAAVPLLAFGPDAQGVRPEFSKDATGPLLTPYFT